MAYLQPPFEMDMHIELLTSIHTEHRKSKDHILKLLAKTFGQNKLATYEIITSSPNYERSTSSSL
jgi:hypothetical protein